MVARGAGAAGPVLLTCGQWDPLGLARRLPSLRVKAWRSAPLLPWRLQCPVRVCAALAAGLRGLGRYLVLCLSLLPLPTPRVPRCVWRAVLSGCPLPSLAGTPFHAVCAFRELGPVALLIVLACPLRVCALALPRRPLPLPLGGVACAPRAVPALGAGGAVPRGPCPSACPAPVPCSVWRALGGAVRSRLPPTCLGVVGVAEGRPSGGCLPVLPGASGVRRSPSPDCPPTGRAVGVTYPRAVGAGVWVWGPYTVPLACTPCGGCVLRGGSVAFVCRGVGLGGGGGRAPCPPFVRPGGACRAGVSSALFRPSAFPGQAAKRVSLASFYLWGAWLPIPLRFVLACLHWARSVRCPGALARARLFPAVPVGAGGWGGGAGCAPAPLSGRGRGDHPPCLGGWGPGPPRLAGRWGGWGGGSRRSLPAPPLGGGPWFPILAPLVLLAHSPPACACRQGSGPPPGWGGMRGGPWTALPGAPADLNPPSALPEWAVVLGGSWGARPSYCSGAPPCAAPRLGPRVAPARWCGLARRPRPPREQAAGGAGARGVQVQPHPPPPRRGPFWGRGGVPSAPGGRRVAPVAPKLGGVSGGGRGGRPPALACHPLSPACPPALYSCRGGCRAAAGVGRGTVSRQWVSAGGGGGGEGGEPPPLARAPVFPGPASEGAAPFLPSWAPPVRRRPAAGRACGRPPRPWCPLTPGAAASSGGVRGRRFFGLPPSALGPKGEGRGGGGGPLVPWRRPLTAEGGRHGSPGLGGQPSAGGSHSSPATLYPESDPRAGPRRGPSSPPAVVARRWQAGGAVRVSGQRLAGCGAIGPPPRSLSPPSLPREVARAPSSRRTVGGAWVGGPCSPPHFLASAVWAVTCAAACVGAGAVAAAGCAGGSASGRGRCARLGGASCWRPHP